MPFISLGDLRDLAGRVLKASKTSHENAALVAGALVRADADGIPSHGVARLPVYADQAKAGKVDGHAVPEITETGTAAVRVDAKRGFAYPAITAGLARARDMVANAGVVAVAIGNSSHAGVLGHHGKDLAADGLAAMIFVNTPAAIAPWGGNRALFGTNPIAFAAPRRAGAPLVIDMSMSRVARGKLLTAARDGTPIPDDWAFDSAGQPTRDPEAAMAGTMRAMGDAKGTQLVFMVELLAAALTGSNFGFEASSFFEAEGPAPRTGQFLIAIDPDRFAGGGFADRMETIVAAILDQPGTRLPGLRRFESRAAAERDGVTLPTALHDDIVAAAESGGSA